MNYQIRETLLPKGINRSCSPLNPIGIVIHETATPNASDEQEYRYFCSGNKNSSAHYFVDNDSISRFIPENEQAWHAGHQSNVRHLSVELCHFDDPKKFEEIWNRGVWLTADICKRRGFGVDKIFSHHDISKMYKETDHADPDSYFATHGKTMDMFRQDVQKLLNGDEWTMEEKQRLASVEQQVTQLVKMMKDQENQTIASWATEAMTWAKEHGVIRGDEKGNLNPNKMMTRQEAIAFLHRAMKSKCC